jgi:hypothetical protein
MNPVIDFIHADGLRHRKWVFPAYFCGVKNCCEGKPVGPGSSHGISAERWLYCVGDDPFAVSMEVSTGKYLPETQQPNQPPQAWDMSWHRTTPEGLADGCMCLSGANCSSDGTTLGAMEWYEQKGERTLVPDDAVFKFLRDELYPQWKQEPS